MRLASSLLLAGIPRPIDMTTLLQSLPPWLESAVLVGVAIATALLLHTVLRAGLRRLPVYDEFDLEGVALHRTRRPARALLVVVALLLVVPYTALPADGIDRSLHALLVLAITAGAWLLIGATQVFQVFVERRFRSDVPDNLRARRVQTRVRLLRRTVTALVVFVALALILTTFESVRRIGVSMFASAGVAGLIVGIAAQPTLSNLVAGIQLALSEPIRLDDVVIVEGEWGWIEEITMTYVVVRIWDLRRLVVPLRWFIENPFENWTRQTADILGTVFLHLDYRAPVGALREELRRIVEAERGELWDGEVCGLQVVGAGERTIEVRALVSAASSPKAWELRCRVRERLVGWLQDHHSEALPRVRAEVEGDGLRRGSTPADRGGPRGGATPSRTAGETPPGGVDS